MAHLALWEGPAGEEPETDWGAQVTDEVYDAAG